MKKKTIALLLVLMLVFGVSVGGTIAYLTDKTEAIQNTFTVGNVSIELTETFNTDSDGDKKNDAWTGKIVPGATVGKDPKITVVEGSEDCYVYALIENDLYFTVDEQTVVVATPNIDTTKWTLVAGDSVKGLYRYNTICSAEAEAEAVIFTNVKYDSDAITEKNISALNNKTITVTAFAHQSANIENVTVADNAAKAQFGF